MTWIENNISKDGSYPFKFNLRVNKMIWWFKVIPSKSFNNNTSMVEEFKLQNIIIKDEVKIVIRNWKYLIELKGKLC